MASSHRILGAAPHIGQRTLRAWVSMRELDFMPPLSALVEDESGQ